MQREMVIASALALPVATCSLAAMEEEGETARDKVAEREERHGPAEAKEHDKAAEATARDMPTKLADSATAVQAMRRFDIPSRPSTKAPADHTAVAGAPAAVLVRQRTSASEAAIAPEAAPVELAVASEEAAVQVRSPPAELISAARKVPEAASDLQRS